MEHSLLESITIQTEQLQQTLVQWSLCNSGSHHPMGLLKMSYLLEEAFSYLGTPIERINIEANAPVLKLRKHPQAAIQVLLGGHYDTVFGQEHPFQKISYLESNRLQGPGVADMKGGLLVLLTALKTLESSPWAGQIGWQILLNPDEEIGSIRSKHTWIALAKEVQLALLFEPSLPDGSLVSTRKGSFTWSLRSHGIRAHAGRELDKGRNAILPLMRLLLQIQELQKLGGGIGINIGQITGGEGANIVPDSAQARLNVRMTSIKQKEMLQEKIKELIETEPHVTLHEESYRPPKEWTNSMHLLYEAIKQCGQALDMHLAMQPSGGVCDGNFIAAVGVPVIDTLGVVGGHLHTEREYVELDSLVTRSALTALFLMRLARDKQKMLPFLKD